MYSVEFPFAGPGGMNVVSAAVGHQQEAANASVVDELYLPRDREGGSDDPITCCPFYRPCFLDFSVDVIWMPHCE